MRPYGSKQCPAPQHPLFLGPHNTKLRGVWIRSLRTGQFGFISHIERKRNWKQFTEDPEPEQPVLWVVYPPDPASGSKTWTAGSLYPEEMKKKASWGNYFEEE